MDEDGASIAISGTFSILFLEKSKKVNQVSCLQPFKVLHVVPNYFIFVWYRMNLLLKYQKTLEWTHRSIIKTCINLGLSGFLDIPPKYDISAAMILIIKSLNLAKEKAFFFVSNHVMIPCIPYSLWITKSLIHLFWSSPCWYFVFDISYISPC